jgi:hypothetical protein
MPGFGAIGETAIGELPSESGGGGEPGVGLQRTFGSMAFASKVFAPGVFRGVGSESLTLGTIGALYCAAPSSKGHVAAPLNKAHTAALGQT